uniref:Centromere protein S n=1 Tax=Xiphophorus maculatus TaxID=8083 RepID=A0A3B5Q9P4_XIPMA
MSVDKEEARQRLKAAVHYTVGRLCQKIGEEEHRREFSRQTIAAIAETTFRECDIFAKDLEAFARHAKRSTVSAEDVKLLARRSRALVGLRKITKLHESSSHFQYTTVVHVIYVYTYSTQDGTFLLFHLPLFSPTTYKIKVKNWPRSSEIPERRVQ